MSTTLYIADVPLAYSSSKANKPTQALSQSNAADLHPPLEDLHAKPPLAVCSLSAAQPTDIFRARKDSQTSYKSVHRCVSER